ncbi:MAG: hypothetical protein HQL51_13450 [Magnetococcales bacterium]|nr:hypothetical protein [Magnetococcales bacterium]
MPLPPRHAWLTALLLLAATLPAGCGYRWAGESAGAPALTGLSREGLRIEGRGSQDAPTLARQLKTVLGERLGLPARSAGGASPVILTLHLQPIKLTQQMENRDGRVEQYRLEIEAKPELTRDGQTRKLPEVRGVATYFESARVIESRTLRGRAEEEAMEDLASSLAELLRGAW